VAKNVRVEQKIEGRRSKRPWLYEGCLTEADTIPHILCDGEVSCFAERHSAIVNRGDGQAEAGKIDGIPAVPAAGIENSRERIEGKHSLKKD